MAWAGRIGGIGCRICTPATVVLFVPRTIRHEGMAFLDNTTGAGCARSRSALGRLFDGGEGRSQHSFSIARPLLELCLGGTLHRRRELFNTPHFRYPRAGPAGLQAVGPAHIRAYIGARHKLKA